MEMEGEAEAEVEKETVVIECRRGQALAEIFRRSMSMVEELKTVALADGLQVSCGVEKSFSSTVVQLMWSYGLVDF